MKKFWIGLCGILTAGAVLAAVSTNNTTYFPSYKLVSSANTNSGVTGLSTGVAYVCIAVTNIANGFTEAAAGTNGDFRLFFYTLTDAAYDSIQAITATNRPTKFRIGKSVLEASASDLKQNYVIEVDLNLGTVTVDSE